MMRKNKNTGIVAKSDGMASRRSLDRLHSRDWFQETDRWFEDLRTDFERKFWGPVVPAGRDDTLDVREPLVDLADNGKEFVLTTEVPGVNKEDLDIRVTPDAIEIAAETRQEKEEDAKDYFFRERSYRSLSRSVSLPEEVLADHAEAKLKDGVLEVRLPKKEPSPKHEPVKVRVE